MVNLDISWRELCDILNLSEYEAKAYLVLVQKGDLNARNLSFLTGIPRTKIYLTLRRLIELGLVNKISEDPVKFAPNPSAEVFQSCLIELKEKFNQLTITVSSLEEIYKKNYSNDISKVEIISMIRGKNQILKKIGEVLSQANENIMIIVDENRSILFFEAFKNILTKLNYRSIHVRIMTGFGDANKYILIHLKKLVKVVESNITLPIIYVNVDNRLFLLALMNAKIIDSSLNTEIAFFSRDQTLEKILNYLLRVKNKTRIILKKGKGNNKGRCVKH